ncbi:hypothetical protein OHR68_06430 [Spirillospora sp. NBC_00431]
MAAKTIAPYAQAAAYVSKDGTVQHSKGVVSVQRTDAGRYTITLEDGIDAEKSAPQATLQQSADWKGEIFVKVTATNTVGVLTGVNGSAADEPFYFMLP